MNLKQLTLVISLIMDGMAYAHDDHQVVLTEVHDATPPDNIGIPIKFDGFIKQQNVWVAEPFMGITTSNGKVHILT